MGVKFWGRKREDPCGRRGSGQRFEQGHPVALNGKTFADDVEMMLEAIASAVARPGLKRYQIETGLSSEKPRHL